MEVRRCRGNVLPVLEIVQEGGARTREKGKETRADEKAQEPLLGGSCVKLSGHGHTPQILVLLERVK